MRPAYDEEEEMGVVGVRYEYPLVGWKGVIGEKSRVV